MNTQETKSNSLTDTESDLFQSTNLNITKEQRKRHHTSKQTKDKRQKTSMHVPVNIQGTQGNSPIVTASNLFQSTNSNIPKRQRNRQHTSKETTNKRRKTSTHLPADIQETESNCLSGTPSNLFQSTYSGTPK